MAKLRIECSQMSHSKAPPYGSTSLPFSPHLRRSLPNMNAPIHTSSDPPKIYPYHLLMITNYRLPPGVDRMNLEVSHGNWLTNRNGRFWTCIESSLQKDKWCRRLLSRVLYSE